MFYTVVGALVVHIIFSLLSQIKNVFFYYSDLLVFYGLYLFLITRFVPCSKGSKLVSQFDEACTAEQLRQIS